MAVKDEIGTIVSKVRALVTLCTLGTLESLTLSWHDTAGDIETFHC